MTSLCADLKYFCRSAEFRRARSGAIMLLVLQLLGTLVGPFLFGWRWNPIWGSPHETLHLAQIAICHVAGAVYVTLWLNRNGRSDSLTRVSSIMAPLYVFPLLVGAVDLATATWNGSRWACEWTLMGAAWIMLPIFVAMPAAQSAGWLVQKCIEARRAGHD